MLYFVETYFAINYLILALTTSLGTLQIVATRYGLRGLSLVGLPRRRGWGYGLGSALIVGGFVWFFWATPDVLSPGPAGSELMLLMGLGMAGALLITLVWASVREEIRGTRPESGQDAVARGLTRLKHMSIWQAWRCGQGAASAPSPPDPPCRAEVR